MAKGHHYPAFVFRFPAMIWLLYLWNDLMFHRNAVVRRHLVQLSKQLSPQSLGDIGFGEGQHLFRWAAQHSSLQVMGIEVDPDHLAFAARYKAKFGLNNLKPLHHDLSANRLSEPVDLLYSVGVLQYIEAHEAFVQNAFASVKAGGHFLLYQPVNGYSYLPGATFLQKHLQGYNDRQGFSRVYQRAELITLFEEAGFRVVWEEQHMGPWQVLAHEMVAVPLAFVLYSRFFVSKVLAALVLLAFMPFSILLRILAQRQPKGKANAVCVLFQKPSLGGATS
jgi:trans-aconitate methyltransferase